MKVNIIGGGLAGTTAAYYLASKGIDVVLIDRKPNLEGPFKNEKLGELVCSNSLKSKSQENACGLLKDEMEIFNALFIEAAKRSSLPSGEDLSVDRELFSSYIDEQIRSNKHIKVVSQDVNQIDESEITLVCSGPDTSLDLVKYIEGLTGISSFSFYDAAAPLVYLSSLDTSKMYFKSRFDKGDGKYLNIPLTKEEYYEFQKELAHAKRVILHDDKHFEACLPIEVIAQRGVETLRHGPLRAVGLRDEEHDPYAVVQLRRDDVSNSLYGLVGFQTNLTYPEQKRVFNSLPGMKDAKYARFGLMHKNIYINAPKLLNRDLSLKGHPNIFFGGQLSGVEGYVESASTGLLAAIYIYMKLQNKEIKHIPLNTMLGSLVNYLVMSNPSSFAPMNACYGILQNPYKKDKLKAYNDSIEALKRYKEENDL